MVSDSGSRRQALKHIVPMVLLHCPDRCDLQASFVVNDFVTAPACSSHHAYRTLQYELCKISRCDLLCSGLAQGDLANPAVVRQLFQAVSDNFDNRCTAFIHNAGLILGFSSKSTYEKAPIVTERTQQQLLAVSTNPDITPSDTELDE